MPEPRRVTELLTREEIAAFTRASDARGAWSVGVTWSIVAGAFALVAVAPHPATVVLAILLLGGRQLALAVLMHEASHRSLFRSKRLNDVVGRWLCGAPVWAHVGDYREHHLRHHRHTGTDEDPDRCLVEPFPTSRRSLARKLARDLVGWTGLKRMVGLLLMDVGLLRYSASGNAGRRPTMSPLARVRRAVPRLGPTLVTNVALAGGLAAVGHGSLYLLWLAAYLTTFSLFLRIRSLAEHACTDRTPNSFRNTRTTHANLLARLFVAPHDVHYHLEHHLLMTVPHYRLRALHRRLREIGALDEAHVAPGYGHVLRSVARG